MENYILIAILVAGALIRLPFLKFPIDDDLGYFAYSAWFRRRGVRIGKDFYTRLPMHWLYTLTFALFGRKPHSPKIFDFIYELLTGAAIYGLCAAALHPATGLIAAAFYLWFSNSASVGLFSGCNERYYAVFTAAGFLFLLMGINLPAWEANNYFFASALFLAATFYFKDVLVISGAAAATAIFFLLPEPADGLLWFGGGYILLAVVVYIPLNSLYANVSDFISLSLEGYKRALQDNPDRGSIKKLLINGGSFFMEAAPLAVIPLLYVFTFGAEWSGAAYIVLAAWLVSTAAIFFIQGVYWPYHFIAFIPPLSVISAVALARFAAEHSGLPLETRFVWWSALAASFAISGFLQIKALMSSGDPEKLSGIYTWNKLEQITAVPEIAEYIRERTSEDDYIYQWGYLYHLYLLTDRLCPVFGCASIAPPAKKGKLKSLQNIVNSLKKNPPKFIVIHIQSIDMSVLEQLTGLRYKMEKVFSTELRVYRLVERGVEAARDVTAGALEELLTDAEVPFKDGMDLLGKGDINEAKQKFDEALSINPAHISAMTETGKLAQKDGDFKSAQKIFETLSNWDDSGVRFHGTRLLLELYSLSGNDTVVDAMADRALDIEPESELAISCALGHHYRSRKNPDRALDIYLRKIKIRVTPENRQMAASVEYHAGEILLEKNLYSKAIEHLNCCLVIEPIHRAAERLLDRAKTALDDIDVKKVLLFRTTTKKKLEATIDSLKARYPGCEISLFAQKDSEKDFSANDKIDNIVNFPFRSFAAAWLLLPSVRRMLRAQRCDIAVIPVRTPSRLQADFDYFNILLYARSASPKKTYYCREPHRARQEAAVSATFYGIAKKLYETAANPFWFAIDLYRLWQHPDKAKIISFTRQPGDLLAHVIKTRWLMKNGVNGVSFESYMGNPYTLYYPPLSFLLMGWLGPVGYLMCQTLVFCAAAAATAIAAGHPWLILFVPYLVTSWYYRVNTIIVGRVDFLAWGLLLSSLASFYFGHPLVAALFFSAALYIHTSVFVIGGLGMIIVAALGGVAVADILLFGLLTIALGLPWWIPFLRNRGKFGFHTIWGGISFWDNVYLCYKSPLLHLALFFTAAAFMGGLAPLHAIISIPMSVYIYGLVRKKYIFHVTNLSGALLTFGTFALFVQPSLPVMLLFLVLINIRDPQDNPRIKPLFEQRVLSDTSTLFHPVGENERVAIECYQDEFWDDNLNWGWLFSVAANKFNFQLMSGVGFDQVDPQLPLEYETKINSDTEPTVIRELLNKTGCRYVTSYTKSFAEKLESMGFVKLTEKEFEPYAYVHGRTYSLYRTPFSVDIIEPAVEWSYIKNGLRFRPNGKNAYTIKLAYYPGWQAHQNGKKLELEDISPGMKVKTDGLEEVRLNFRSGLFLK